MNDEPMVPAAITQAARDADIAKLRIDIDAWQHNNTGKCFPCHAPEYVERIAKEFKNDLTDSIAGVVWCAGSWWRHDDWRRITADDMAIMVQDFWRMVSDTPLTAKGIRDLLAGWRTMPEFALSMATMGFYSICVQCMGTGSNGREHDVLCIDSGDGRGLRKATDEEILKRMHTFTVT